MKWSNSPLSICLPICYYFKVAAKGRLHLSERALRLELRPLIDELNRVLQFQAEQPDSDELEKTHEQIGVKLEQLEPFVSRDDDPLYEDTLELAKDFKKLASLRERIQNRIQQ